MADTKYSEKQGAQDVLARFALEFLEMGGSVRDFLGDRFEKECETLLRVLETLECKVAAKNVWTCIRYESDVTKRSALWLAETDYRKP